MIIFVKIEKSQKNCDLSIWNYYHCHVLIFHQSAWPFINKFHRCLNVYTKNYIFTDFIQSSTERVLDVKYVCICECSWCVFPWIYITVRSCFQTPHHQKCNVKACNMHLDTITHIIKKNVLSFVRMSIRLKSECNVRAFPERVNLLPYIIYYIIYDIYILIFIN